MYQGIDTAARISEAAAIKLKAEGIAFAGRYLVPPGMSKELTAAEARDLHAAGLAILLCWEIDAERAKRGAQIGANDGERARTLARQMGVPTDAAVYFAVDFMPAARDYDAIEYYFRAASGAVAPYRCGIYGPFDIVEEMHRRIPQLLIWQCVAWSSGRISEHLSVYQRLWSGAEACKALQAKVGFPVDLNDAKTLEGLWRPQAPSTPWYEDTVAWALKEGVVTEARPTDAATRAEVMQMIRNYNRRFEAEDLKTASGLTSD